jgi:hypothetical protein
VLKDFGPGIGRDWNGSGVDESWALWAVEGAIVVMQGLLSFTQGARMGTFWKLSGTNAMFHPKWKKLQFQVRSSLHEMGGLELWGHSPPTTSAFVQQSSDAKNKRFV